MIPRSCNCTVFIKKVTGDIQSKGIGSGERERENERKRMRKREKGVRDSVLP